MASGRDAAVNASRAVTPKTIHGIHDRAVLGIITINTGCRAAAIAMAIAVIRTRPVAGGMASAALRTADPNDDEAQLDAMMCCVPDNRRPGTLDANAART